MIAPALDALAAAFCGVGVALIAFSVKPVPMVISSFLSPAFAMGWGILLMLGSVAAVLGSLTRTRKASGRQVISYGLELLGWPAIAWSALIFAAAAINYLGLIPSLLTVGFSGFVCITCIGHWWALVQARRLAGEAWGQHRRPPRE